ncbi:hypothetical protein ACVWYG_003726 [Pedobacter sp. UYEF25]
MKTAFYLVVTCFISTGAMFGALGAKNPSPLFGIAFGIWALFIWGVARREKESANRKGRERLFQEYMRNQLMNNRNRN